LLAIILFENQSQISSQCFLFRLTQGFVLVLFFLPQKKPLSRQQTAVQSVALGQQLVGTIECQSDWYYWNNTEEKK